MSEVMKKYEKTDSNREEVSEWGSLTKIKYDPEKAQENIDRALAERAAKEGQSAAEKPKLPTDTEEIFINQMVQIHDATIGLARDLNAEDAKRNPYYEMSDKIKVKQNLMQTFDYSGGKLAPTAELDNLITEYEAKLAEAQQLGDKSKIEWLEEEVAKRREARELLRGGPELYDMFERQATELQDEGKVLALQQRQEQESRERSEDRVKQRHERVEQQVESLINNIPKEELERVHDAVFDHVDKKQVAKLVEEKIREIPPEVFEHISNEYQRNPKEAYEVVVSQLTKVLGLENRPKTGHLPTPKNIKEFVFGPDGYYEPDSQELLLNPVNTKMGIVKLASHEMFHIWQDEEVFAGTERGTLYAYNNKNYITPDQGMKKYADQLVEAEAYAFSNRFVSELKKYMGVRGKIRQLTHRSRRSEQK